MTIKIKETASGSRNVSVEISGILEKVHEDKPFRLVKFETHALKLTRLMFAIQEKGGLLLWWDEACEHLVLPLESRGGFNFDGRKAPDHWDGQIWATAFKIDEPKGFLIIMDFDK
jgi:hypothetical protein